MEEAFQIVNLSTNIYYHSLCIILGVDYNYRNHYILPSEIFNTDERSQIIKLSISHYYPRPIKDTQNSTYCLTVIKALSDKSKAVQRLIIIMSKFVVYNRKYL
jgi:hypothetical protein